MSVYKAIQAVAAQMAVEGIGKSRKNEQQGYKFRGIDETLNALAPALAKNGLVVIPRMISRQMTERVTAKGTPLFSVVVEAEFDFIASEDGSKHTARTFGEAMDSADKATNKAMSVAYKYAAFLTFCIPLEGMAEDADAVTHEVKATVPKGYEDWTESAEAVAVEGMDALKAFWKTTPKEIRDYATSVGNAWWEALKAKSSKVKAEVPA